jgi:hypothetical protein
MPRLTIEQLSKHRPECVDHKDALVLCLDGEVISGQIGSMFICGVDEVPEFTVTFSLFGSDTGVALKVDNG